MGTVFLPRECHDGTVVLAVVAHYNRQKLGVSSISTATTNSTSNSVGNEGNNSPMAIDTKSPPNSKVNDVTTTNDDLSTTATLNSGTVGSVFESPILDT
jgi:hypothetical protein